MLQHHQSQIGITEDEYSLSVGLFGTGLHGKKECIVQAAKVFSKQDSELGHNTIHVDYDGWGGYGLVGLVDVIGNSRIEIHLRPGAMKAHRILNGGLEFIFDSSIAEDDLRFVERLCQLTNTEFRRH